MRPNIKACINTSDHDENIELYQPLLKWAARYDRGVGYFTSGWLKKNAEAMLCFVLNGGKARWITSPILDELDLEMFNNIEKYNVRCDLINNMIEYDIDQIFESITQNTREFLAWMIFDGLLEVRFAVPTNKLDGDFHDKFGIGYKGDDAISFNGSQNDSIKGATNYESFKVFTTWNGHSDFVNDDINRFEKLWNNHDENVKVYELSTAVKDKIFKKRSYDRPYPVKNTVNKWNHQDEACDEFIRTGNGILEMATGTGKTKTALKIVKKLYEMGLINSLIITTYGTDLLNQWSIELLNDDFFSDWLVYKKYDEYKELGSYYTDTKKTILIVSRTPENLSLLFDKLNENQNKSTIIIFDEIHGLGSYGLKESLSGKIKNIKFRLGLSATPEREYDEEGSRFITDEVGEVIYQFSIEDAIKRGILCEFNYHEINYSLTDSEKREISTIIAKYDRKKSIGELFSIEDMYRDLANVRKLAEDKLLQFKEFIKKNRDLLDYCIIFVQTSEYGKRVQEILIEHISDYHVYYADTDKFHLNQFANGQTKVLITCRKLNEGIDIKKCKNIVLFSSDRSKLVTIQRIGRCLRTTTDPYKIANVVDFIDFESDADVQRRDWISEISSTRRENNGY